MTISSTTRIAGPFIGNGTASAFPFTFKVFAATDLDVIKLTVSTGTESTLVLTTDYTVSLNGDQNSNPGGTVTLTAGALASGFTLTITSNIANLQPTDLTNQGGFYPEVITDSLDRATIQIQQIADIGDRTLKIPISDGTLNMELPTKTERANTFLSFDANGLPSVVTAGSSGAPATITRQVFSGTGSQTVFTLASDPGALGNSAQVYIGGVYQQRSTYTIAGTTLTFSAAPVAGTDNIEFVNFLTSNIGATSADLVTYTPSGSGAVARSAASKFGETVSVKDFGAVGDGVANDVAAIQSALASGAKELHFPSGTYNLGTIPKGTDASGVFNIVSQNGLRFVADGLVTFQVAFTNTGLETTDIVFRFASCSNISFIGQFSFVDPTNTSTVVLGVTAMSFQPNCSNVSIEWMSFTNLIGGIATIGTPNTVNVSAFKVGMIVANNVMYPLSWRNADGIEASLRCTNCQREYFLYACRNVKLTVTAINPNVTKYATIAGYGTAYSSIATENIEVDHYVQFAGAPDRAAVQIVAAPATSAGAITGLRNLKIRVHVNASSPWAFGAIGAILIRADVDSGAPITTNADASLSPKDCEFVVTNNNATSWFTHDVYCAYQLASGSTKARASWATPMLVNNDFLRVFHNTKVFNWTPVLQNGWAIGNGTSTGRFHVDEARNMVTVWGSIEFGSTSTFAAAELQIVQPTLDALGYSQTSQMLIDTGTVVGGLVGTATFQDNTTAQWYSCGVAATGAGAGGFAFRHYGNVGVGSITSTVPFTWANGDLLYFTASYTLQFQNTTT